MGRWIALFLFTAALTAEVKRVVIVKVDGVPADILERELGRTDPSTGKSVLPWIDKVFAQSGARLANFYVRGISLSAPSWSMLDTGHHMEIKGNAEFDRYTCHVYDYLNFFPFYVGYALSRRVDMPGVEVLDQLGIPFLIDYFPPQSIYQGFQLFQRGVRWKTLQHSIQNRFSKRSLRDLLDEWTMGFEIGSSVEQQTERELIQKLSDPQIQYLDYFTGDFDHVAHLNPDAAAQRSGLQRIDALIGRIWTAIESSPEAASTVLVLVSDHGMNTQPGVYSQGYDLVAFLNSKAGGAHHVMTDRRPLTEFKLKGLDPFVSEVVTPSDDSLYLKGASKDYPTALLDLDGNERAAVYLRNSNWNAIHILLEGINRAGVQPAMRKAAIRGILQIIEENRPQWRSEITELRDELAALDRAIKIQRAKVDLQPKKWTAAERTAGLDKTARRLAVQLESWREQLREYSDYANAIDKLIALSAEDFDKHRFSASDLIPRRAMGDGNSRHDLRSYIVGPNPTGLVLAPDGSLDFARSFSRIDYLPLLTSLTVKNNVQPNVSSHPVDFVAMRLQPEPQADEAILLYGGEDRQAMILARHDSTGALELRYAPAQGAQMIAGLPLHLFEDPALVLPNEDRARWLDVWHPASEWFQAVHKTEYSNGIIGLHEQFHREPVPTTTGDAGLLKRFNARRRRLAEPDFLIFSNDHWNFNVRGFNPGGNHGSLRRSSTHSVLMFAGGGIPQHLVIQDPYDSLSFVPEILDLLEFDKAAAKLPGRPIRELSQQSPY